MTPTYSKTSSSTEVLTAGEHTFDVYYNEDDKNYEYAKVTLTITITQKTVAVVWGGLDKDFAYTGKEQKDGITATYDGNAMDIEFVNNANVDNKIKYSFANAGTYTLTAKVKSSDTIASNYIINNTTKVVTINKAVISLHDKEFSYDYNANGYTIVPKVDYNGTTYTLSDSGTDTTLGEMGLHTGDLVYSGTGVTGKKFTDGGTYTVTISISANEPNWTIDPNNNTMIVKINSVYVEYVLVHKYTYRSLLSTKNGSITKTKRSSEYFNIDDVLSDKFIATASAIYTELENAAKSEASAQNNYKSVSSNQMLTVIVAENTCLNETRTINSNVTLLVPYDSNYDTTEYPTTTTSTTLSVYKKLTINSMLTVNGVLNVSGKQYAKGSPTRTTGSYGLIEMTNSSNITVNSGGKLISFGFIKNRRNNTDEGTITLLSGASAYEPLRIDDWCGGQIANSVKVKGDFFPFSQFYIGNIESQLEINQGASLNAHIALYISNNTLTTTIEMFGANGLFGIDNGHVTKKVESGKIKITINTATTINTNDITAEVSGYSMSTSGKEVPICGYYNIIIDGTANITNRFKLLPGASVKITENGKCNIKTNGALIGVINNDGSNYNYNSLIYNYKESTLTYPKGTSVYASNSPVTICVDGTLDVNGTLTGNISTQVNGSTLNISKDSKLTATIVLTCDINVTELFGSKIYSLESANTTSFIALTNGQPIEKDSNNTVTYIGNSAGYFVKS